MAFDAAWRLLGHAADAEDAVQDAMLDAFRLHQRQDVANWGALLRHLATRRAIDRLRARRRTQPLASEPKSIDPPDGPALERELAERLRTAVAALPDREAAVFSLRVFAELSNQETAAVLSISPDAAAVALHKARAKLKEALNIEGARR
jgi:RNA polymerase sigma-70 factor, ECF subfamily